MSEKTNQKPVKCGCGGEVKVYETPLKDCEGYFVQCNDCRTATFIWLSEAEAITAWNKAMGADRCCNTCDSYEAGRYCLLWSIFCPSDHWCKDWSGNEDI